MALSMQAGGRNTVTFPADAGDGYTQGDDFSDGINFRGTGGLR